MNSFLDDKPPRFARGFMGTVLLAGLLLLCGQPAFAAPTTPTSDFIDNQDGTVTHKTTGLMWMRCALGQMWTGSACSGSAKDYTYDEAIVLTDDFAGHSDWRLPNIAELHTIVERENYNPAINTEMFPNTSSALYWSSSPVAYYSSYAWIVYFYYGYDSWSAKNASYYVRLVRSGQSFGSLPLTTPDSDFTDNHDGTVTHKRTGLIWQRCSVGQTWTGSTCSGSASTYSYNAGLAIKSTFTGHKDWRIPNANELLSIVEYGAHAPAINQTLFPNTPFNNFYWSSSPVAYHSYYAWFVYFYNGNVRWDGKDYGNYVRLVRSGQWLGVLPYSIAQSPLSGSPGDVFVQWGNNFSPNTTATLHIKKPDGSEYPTQRQAIDSAGHFGINYEIRANKPAGTYSWWVVDGKTGKKSAVISYQVTPLLNVAKISGKLHSNAANGAALSGAKVSTGITATTTAGDGSFSLAKIPVGQQVIHFSKAGYQSFSVTIPVPASGSYNMGNRWLVQDGLIKPTIAQAPMSGLPGTTFVQWGTGFTPNGTATLHFKKPDNSQYPPSTVALDSSGHLETSYRTPMEKPAGVYQWWAVDDATHKASNSVAYTVTEEVNTCEAPTQYDSLLKIDDATCRDKWNLTIFYKERYNGYFSMNQKFLMGYINGSLDTNRKISIAIDGISSILSVADIPSLKGKDIQSLVGIGTNQSLQFDAKIINNEYADLLYSTIGAVAETVATVNPWPTIEYAMTTGSQTMNNLFATIEVTTLTKRFQELEIAKQFLLDYYRNGSRIDLVAADYGLPASSGVADIIKAIGDKIGAKNPWYWFDDYDAHNVVEYIRTDMTIVSMKQTAYSE